MYPFFRNGFFWAEIASVFAKCRRKKTVNIGCKVFLGDAVFIFIFGVWFLGFIGHLRSGQARANER